MRRERISVPTYQSPKFNLARCKEAFDNKSTWKIFCWKSNMLSKSKRLTLLRKSVELLSEWKIKANKVNASSSFIQASGEEKKLVKDAIKFLTQVHDEKKG